MKKIIVFLMIMFCVVGCAKVSFKDGELSYWRLGTQKMEGLEFDKLDDGSISVKLQKQEGSTGDIAETAKNLSKLLLMK